MSKWEYVKGSAEDFEGAPDWATIYAFAPNYPENDGWFFENDEPGSKWKHRLSKAEGKSLVGLFSFIEIKAICRRRPSATSRRNDELLADAVSHNKYNRTCKGVTVDVYDVIQAFSVTNPALQHLVKKALCTGLRGHKDRQQDLQDIFDSAKRAIELEKSDDN